jgi:hypothetical protein
VAPPWQIENIQRRADDVLTYGERCLTARRMLHLLADDGTTTDDASRQGELWSVVRFIADALAGFGMRAWSEGSSIQQVADTLKGRRIEGGVR